MINGMIQYIVVVAEHVFDSKEEKMIMIELTL